MELLQPNAGFVIKTVDERSRSKVFVNVVSHPMIRRPVNAQNQQVSEEHLELQGMHNLRVPLDVQEVCTTKDKKGVDCKCVDILFNPCVVSRCLQGRNCDYFRQYTTELALKFAEENTGMKLSRTFHILSRVCYKGGTGNNGQIPRVFTAAIQPLEEDENQSQKAKKQLSAMENLMNAAKINDNNDNDNGIRAAASKNNKSQAVKKGFLSDTKGVLYPNGSTEGTLPPGAGDPLGWLPEKLRSKVHVVNQAGDKETQKAIEEYAATGRVSKAPGVIPGSSVRDDSNSSNSSDHSSREERPEYKIDENKEDSSFVVVVKLPKISSMAGVELDASALEFDLKVVGVYRLLFDWPSGKRIDVDSVKAKFSKKTKELTVTAAIAK